MTLAIRPDLSQRTALSKSELSTAFYCPTKAYFTRTTREPYVVNADMTYGSCVDAGVEQIVASHRAYGRLIDVTTPRRAASEVMVRDGNDVDLDEVGTALDHFERDVVPEFDWSFAATQHTLKVTIPGLGDVEGHPDLILSEGTILDVKVSKRAKDRGSIRYAPELPFYAYLREQEMAERPPRVGYLTWVRTSGKWQTLLEPVDDDLIAEGRQSAIRRANMRRLIDTVAAKGANPCDYFDGPKHDGFCSGCQFVDRCDTGQRRTRDVAA